MNVPIGGPQGDFFGAGADMYAADAAAQAQILKALLGYYGLIGGQQYGRANTLDQLEYDRYNTLDELGYNRLNTLDSLGLQQYLGDLNAGTERYGYDTSFANTLANVLGGLGTTSIGIQPQMLAEENKQARFDETFPFIQQQFGNFWDTYGQGAPGGGPVGEQPRIDTGPLYTPAEEEAKVNQALGQNAQAEASANRASAESLGGRGFTGSSPQQAAITARNAVGRSIADTRARTDIPLQLRQPSRAHQLQAQGLAEQQFSNRQQEELARQRNQLALINPLIQSLVGFI